MPYGIYMNKHPDSILLVDGAWTNESNCFKCEYGYVSLLPILFLTKGGARNYAFKKGMHIGKKPWHYQIKKYQGPDEIKNLKLIDL